MIHGANCLLNNVMLIYDDNIKIISYGFLKILIFLYLFLDAFKYMIFFISFVDHVIINKV